MGPNHNGYLYSITPTPKAQKRGWKDSMSQKIREFAGRLGLLVTSEATPIKSHPYDLPKCELTRTTTTDMPVWMGEDHTQRTTGSEGTLSVGEIIFSKEEHTHWLVIQLQMITLKTGIQVTFYRLSRLY